MSLTKTKKIGASYNRVSDDDSAFKEHGSLEQQEHMGRETAELLSLKTGIKHIIDYILTEDEGKSGGNTDRPKYQEMWNLIARRRIDFIVAKEISRLNRSMKDFCDLMEHCKKNGVNVHIKGLDIDFNSPIGELIFKLLALIAEFERTLIQERTKSGIRSGMLNNSKIPGGRATLGFDIDPQHPGRRLVNKPELDILHQILDLIPEFDSLPAVCKALKQHGIKNKSGSEIRPDSLRRLLADRKNEGILEVNVGSQIEKKIVERPLPHGCVVDLEKLTLARNKIRELDEKFGRRTKVQSRNYLLTGLLKAEDGSPFQGISGTSKTGEKKYYYINKQTKYFSLPAEELEDAVVRAIGCFKNEDEVKSYVSDALKQITSSF